MNKEKISYAIGVLIFIAISLVLVISILSIPYGILKELSQEQYEYIDLDNNKGISYNCERNMSCMVDGKRIAVKEFTLIYKQP